MLEQVLILILMQLKLTIPSDEDSAGNPINQGAGLGRKNLTAGGNDQIMSFF